MLRVQLQVTAEPGQQLAATEGAGGLALPLVPLRSPSPATSNQTPSCLLFFFSFSTPPPPHHHLLSKQGREHGGSGRAQRGGSGKWHLSLTSAAAGWHLPPEAAILQLSATQQQSRKILLKLQYRP